MASSVINLSDNEGRTGNMMTVLLVLLFIRFLFLCLPVALHLAVAAGNLTLVDALVSDCLSVCVFISAYSMLG